MKTAVTRNILLAGMLLAAMLVELMIGRSGWILPLVLPVFYFITLNTAWHKAGFAAIFTGAAMDLALGRNFPVTIFALLVMILAAYSMRRKHPSELPDVLGSILGSMAAAEAVFALFSHVEYGWGLLLQWMVLSLAGTVLAIPVIQLGRFIMELLEVPDCFIPRSKIWKQRRLHNASTRSRQS